MALLLEVCQEHSIEGLIAIEYLKQSENGTLPRLYLRNSFKSNYCLQLAFLLLTEKTTELPKTAIAYHSLRSASLGEYQPIAICKVVSETSDLVEAFFLSHFSAYRGRNLSASVCVHQRLIFSENTSRKCESP
ncbi:hypothetical protein F7734_03930 [Scytonema sp. UIC 10036]|uniref:hypothetical protein n=1 Tax=Scytonema sp. UIC 10036 TaxID=2304196 RepID=UPI0012DA41E1|nr:hypothetical protein [Scytonema sp. UIC 10036]MUG91677.1 hypothetical protein [Scytonema sp. UIC 10036]